MHPLYSLLEENMYDLSVSFKKKKIPPEPYLVRNTMNVLHLYLFYNYCFSLSFKKILANINECINVTFKETMKKGN